MAHNDHEHAGQIEIPSITFSESLQPFHAWYMETQENPLKSRIGELKSAGLTDEMLQMFLKKSGLGDGVISDSMLFLLCENKTEGNVELYVGHQVKLPNGKIPHSHILKVEDDHMKSREAMLMNTFLNEKRLEFENKESIVNPTVTLEAKSYIEMWNKLKDAKLLPFFQNVFKGNNLAPQEVTAPVKSKASDIPKSEKEEERELIKKFGKSKILALKKSIASRRKTAVKKNSPST